MTDPINLYKRPLGSVNGSRPATRKEGVSAEVTSGAADAASSAAAAAPKPRVSGDEKLELSETARKTMADPSFDRAKVEAIKTALKEGSYPLDSRRIAESFVALERLIKD